MKDVFGQALLDYYHGSFAPPLLLHNEYGPPEEIPIESYFFDEQSYSDMEVFALQQLCGKILDIGAASGRHALHLQRLGMDITAMDISPSCGKLMKEMGVKKIVIDSIWHYSKEQFDTIFMLMNGVGLVGTINELKKFLIHLKRLLSSKGQLILDSTDISYLYDNGKFPKDKYFGELTFQYEYKNIVGDSFDWLYIDSEKLIEIAHFTGWNCQIIYSDDSDAYLARLKIQ
jgi:SAM-dependent methyltransferase